MSRYRIIVSLISISFALHAAGCAEEPLDEEQAALEDVEAALTDDADEADDIGEAPGEAPGQAPDLVAHEPAGTPPMDGELVPAPRAGIEGNYTGGDVMDPSEEQPLTPEAQAKIASVQAEVAAAACTNPGEPVDKILNFTQYAQTKGYYCGPATGYMIIRYLHGANYRSRKNNATLSQANLAKSAGSGSV